MDAAIAIGVPPTVMQPIVELLLLFITCTFPLLVSPAHPEVAPELITYTRAPSGSAAKFGSMAGRGEAVGVSPKLHTVASSFGSVGGFALASKMLTLPGEVKHEASPGLVTYNRSSVG